MFKDRAPNPCPPRFRTGAQIRAARALLGWRRSDLAKAANLHPNSVSYWEKKEHHPRREPIAVEHMRKALYAAGVATLGTSEPGVYKRRIADASIAPVSRVPAPSAPDMTPSDSEVGRPPIDNGVYRSPVVTDAQPKACFNIADTEREVGVP